MSATTTSPELGRTSVERAVKSGLRVTILTGGSDKPYALGLADALITAGVAFDFIGSDEVDSLELRQSAQVNFLNFRGDMSPEAGVLSKVARVARLYLKLMAYACASRPKIFHILWNNKFELLDRTALMMYYKLLGKRVVLTAHNVNRAARDGSDSWLNRLTLKMQYRLADHVFVHTERMRSELLSDFGVPAANATVIPFGINNTVPNTALTPAEAKQKLGLQPGEKALLFFGRIVPYKGLEYLINAMAEGAPSRAGYRVIIAGSLPRGGEYWNQIQSEITRQGVRERIIEKIEFVPDEQTELYFKAADALVLPYTDIFQSGVLFLAYSFGLPVIAADVGSFREDIVDGETGFVFESRNTAELAGTIARYFASALYQQLEQRRAAIKEFANQRYSWREVAAITTARYTKLLA
jgi:glycosyltransferase involved in cell wall biosynthesis